MATAEKFSTRESKNTENYDTQRRECHNRAFDLAVETLRYMGKPIVVDKPGYKVRRLRTTNWVPYRPPDAPEIYTNVRLQYVEIGDTEYNLPVKRFEIYAEDSVMQSDSSTTLVATLENPTTGASAIAYEGRYIPTKYRPKLDEIVVDLVQHIRDTVQAESVYRNYIS